MITNHLQSVLLGFLVLFSTFAVKATASVDLAKDKFIQKGRRLVHISIDEIESDWHRLQQKGEVGPRATIVHKDLRNSDKEEQLELFFAAILRESAPNDPELPARLTLAFLRATRYSKQRANVKIVLRTRLQGLIQNLLDEPKKCKI